MCTKVRNAWDISFLTFCFGIADRCMEGSVQRQMHTTHFSLKLCWWFSKPVILRSFILKIVCHSAVYHSYQVFMWIITFFNITKCRPAAEHLQWPWKLQSTASDHLITMFKASRPEHSILLFLLLYCWCKAYYSVILPVWHNAGLIIISNRII